MSDRCAFWVTRLSILIGDTPPGFVQTFLFEYQEDYDLMYRIIHDEPERERPGSGIRFNGTTIDRNWRLSEMPRTLTDEQLNRLGFDAMAIDLLDGPDAVLCYLADAANLTKIPLQLNRRPLANSEIEKLRVLARYYDRDGSYSVKYSTYGGRFAQHDFRALQRAKILNSTGALVVPLLPVPSPARY